MGVITKNAHRLAVRQQNLEKYKDNLDDLGLLPADPKEQARIKVGDCTSGEWETTGKLINHYSNADPYFLVSTWEVIPPGKPKERTNYTYISERNIGVCVVPIVNRKFVVLVKQHRFSLSRWRTEMPRGAVTHMEGAPETLLFGELPALKKVASLRDIIPISLPKGVDQNTGTHDSTTHYFVAHLDSRVDTAFQLKEALEEYPREDLKPLAFTLEEMNALEDQGLVYDQHSLTSWYLAKKHLRNSFNIPII